MSTRGLSRTAGGMLAKVILEGGAINCTASPLSGVSAELRMLDSKRHANKVIAKMG
jgi:hypothetical protein